MALHKMYCWTRTTIYQQQFYYIYIVGILIFTNTLVVGSSYNRLESSLLSSEGNNVISPWSLISTLVPLQIGADNDTKDELTDIIGNYQSFGVNQTPTLGTSLTALLTSGNLFLNYKSQLIQNIPNILVEENFDFTEDNINIINNLTEKETNGLIKNIIKPGQLKLNNKIIIMNAFYFKGNWRTNFIEKHQIPFYTILNGKETSTRIEMMYQRNSYYLADVPELQSRILEIPYALKQNTSSTTVMQIILPNTKFGLTKLMEKLDTFDLKSIRMKLGEVDLYLPKFKIESEIVIDAQVAKQIGLSKTFSNDANLSKLSSTQLQVDKIISKTVIDVNEDGTEAASGTASFLVPLSGLMYDSFIVDHPFAFSIFEGRTVLFSGTVSNPTGSTQEVTNYPEVFNQTEATTTIKEVPSNETETEPIENSWWIHTGKPEYLIPPPLLIPRFQQPEPIHSSGIHFPFHLSDPTTQIVIHSHLQNQSSLNNTV